MKTKTNEEINEMLTKDPIQMMIHFHDSDFSSRNQTTEHLSEGSKEIQLVPEV